jgi:hypothetical protein
MATLALYCIQDFQTPSGDVAPAGSLVFRVATDNPDTFEVPPGLELREDNGGSVWTPPMPAEPRVVSVLPVAMRRALRTMPWPGYAHALAYVHAALSQPGFEDASDAWEYSVRVYRADILALAQPLGIDEATADAALALAASYPGSGAEFE